MPEAFARFPNLALKKSGLGKKQKPKAKARSRCSLSYTKTQKVLPHFFASGVLTGVSGTQKVTETAPDTGTSLNAIYRTANIQN
ncbi:MAG: hypothetical protein RBS36_11370 [Thiomicrospira sp.]|jgi:hypothetical protein|nr:hypothetical protein [Thiomicrospira sp.]MDY0137759.1 hypothetical protein [Thiomicrospira sp.]